MLALIADNTHSMEIIMTRIRRCLTALAGLCCALLLGAATAPAALATLPPPDPNPAWVVTPPTVHTIVAGGMPGWQITLIAVGAALAAAVIAVMLDRTRTARRQAARPAT
jgi:hypothetical protein